jgi:hypothetical protein
MYRKMVHVSFWDDVEVETNRYATDFYQKYPNSKSKSTWFATTSDEIQAYFSLCILMAQVQKPTLQSYWSIKKSIYSTFFSEVMPYTRFLLISKLLHFVNNENSDSANCLNKLQPVIDHLKQNFKTVYYPEENVAIDESLMKFRGRLSYIQFNPQKTARFGIKFYKICESNSGYCSDFDIYTGKKPKPANKENPTSEAVVVDLMQPYLDNGYTVFVDNWYTSPSSFVRLTERDTNAIGTVRSTK